MDGNYVFFVHFLKPLKLVKKRFEIMEFILK